MNAFYEHHKDSIRFGYRCFDRILLNGLIQPFQQPERVIGFFDTYRHLYPVSRDVLRGAADRFQVWVKKQADKWNAPIVEAPKGRRDEFVEPYFRGAHPDRVVVILKAREPARIMTAIGDKNTNRWHLQIADRWVVQYNFYVNDQRWGRMFVRMCPYLPFSARVCLWPSACAKKASTSSNVRMLFSDVRHPSVCRSWPTPSLLKIYQAVAINGCPFHTLLHRDRAPSGRLPAPAVLLTGRIVRQPDLSSAGRPRQTG